MGLIGRCVDILPSKLLRAMRLIIEGLKITSWVSSFYESAYPVWFPAQHRGRALQKR
jgi:hypothetical protein